MVSRILVVLLLLALATHSGAVYADADHAIEHYEEPQWNAENWDIGKTYYVTWAHLQACVNDASKIYTLDQLRSNLTVSPGWNCGNACPFVLLLSCITED